MHLEVMCFKLIFSVEVILAILTGIAGMDLPVMLFPLDLIIKCCTTFFTAVFIVLVLSHMIFSFTEVMFKTVLKYRISRCFV